ncbi:MAG: hypothetical protein LUD52_02150 [Opitutae bacterium]|nr:hypothetical protein [Opitutae bacterium]
MSSSKLVLSTLVAAAATITAASAFAGEVTEYSEAYKRGDHAADNTEGNEVWYFTALDFSSFFGTTDLVLSSDGTSSGSAIDVATNNIYFSGTGEKTSTVTITGADIDTSDLTTNSYGNVSTYYAFIVEGSTVTFSGSGVDITELGLNLSIGTMSSATLAITDGAKVATKAFYSVVGSNGATGTIEVSGSDSELHTQQIMLGLGTASLESESNSLGDGYYDARYLQTEAEYTDRSAAIEGGDNSAIGVGVINITNGGVMYVGADGDNKSSSENKLQLSNGSISVSGIGSALYLGENSDLVVGGEISYLTDDGTALALGINYKQAITVSGGGTVTNDNQTRLAQLDIGLVYAASVSTSTIDVSGSGSSFDISVGSAGAYFAYNPGYYNIDGEQVAFSGGQATIDVTASNGGTFTVSSTGGIYVADEGYMTLTTDDFTPGQSAGLAVSFSATTDEATGLGGTINLVAETREESGVTYASSIFFGRGNSSGTNSISVSADGAASEVNISAAGHVFANTSNLSGVEVSFSISNNAEMSISTEYGGIYFYTGTKIEVASGGTLSTSANASYGTDLYGAAVNISDGGKWKSDNIVYLYPGSSVSISSNGEWESSGDIWMYSGGKIEISDGGVLAANGGLLAYSGNSLVISSGGKLTSDSGSITFYSGSTLTLNVVITEEEAVSGLTEFDHTLIEGNSVTVAGSSNFSIVVDVSVLTALDLDAGEEFVIDIIDSTSWSYTGTVADKVSIVGGNSSKWEVSSSATNGKVAVILSYVPEPSMFGFVAGLAALGFVATRRRRNRGNKA